jgi:hypothetical protein
VSGRRLVTVPQFPNQPQTWHTIAVRATHTVETQPIRWIVRLRRVGAGFTPPAVDTSTYDPNITSISGATETTGPKLTRDGHGRDGGMLCIHDRFGLLLPRYHGILAAGDKPRPYRRKAPVDTRTGGREERRNCSRRLWGQSVFFRFPT